MDNIEFRPLFDGLAFLLRGNPVILYGEELEYLNKDKYMRWDTSNNCGFNKNGSAIEDLDCKNSVKSAIAHGSGETLFNVYETLLKLTQEPSLNWGDIEFANSDHIIAYTRIAFRFPGFIVAANTKAQARLVDFKEFFPSLPEHSKVEYFYGSQANTEFAAGSEVSNSHILMKPGEFLVLKFDN
jgi:hypothetical protein